MYILLLNNIRTVWYCMQGDAEKINNKNYKYESYTKK